MTANPYAPPNANVADAVHENAAPALWNPNAAANWSILFSPIFGAFLHMKNWQALGEAGKASAAKLWIIVGVLLFLGLALIPLFLPFEEEADKLSRPIALIFLLSWYFSSAKHQAKYVKDRFGSTYPRKGWGIPLLLAVVAIIGFVVVVMVVAVIAGLLFAAA